MSKASMDNKRVKKQITEALFSLLQDKPFSEITVTDIVKRANVARASYYRNFENKEQIIEAAMDDLRDEIMADIPMGSPDVARDSMRLYTSYAEE